MILKEETYVDKAEAAIKKLAAKKDRNDRPVSLVSTSKLRNLLAMTSDIYNEILNLPGEELDESVRGRIEYLRIRFIYESGREPKVKDLTEAAEILPALREIQGSRKRFLLFSRYMEALVAFRKFYGNDKDE